MRTAIELYSGRGLPDNRLSAALQILAGEGLVDHTPGAATIRLAQSGIGFILTDAVTDPEAMIKVTNQ